MFVSFLGSNSYKNTKNESYQILIKFEMLQLLFCK